MTYVPQIPDWFNPRKAAQVAAFFALQNGGKINILKVAKLIYLADRRSMLERDHPITGDNFVSMKFGPVNTYTYTYMCGSAPTKQEMWAEFIAPRWDNDLPLSQHLEISQLDELSRSDLKIMQETWDEFKDTDRFDLAEWTHKYCPEWRDPSSSSIPIDFATVFKHLKKPDPVGLAEELQAERGLSMSLSAR